MFQDLAEIPPIFPIGPYWALWGPIRFVPVPSQHSALCAGGRLLGKLHLLQNLPGKLLQNSLGIVNVGQRRTLSRALRAQYGK